MLLITTSVFFIFLNNYYEYSMGKINEAIQNFNIAMDLDPKGISAKSN